MKFTLKQEFPYSLEKVMKAREMRGKGSRKMDNLDKYEIILEEMRGDVRFRKRNMELGKSIPSIVQSVLPKNMLNLVEESSHNMKTQINDFEVFSEGNKDKFLLKGQTVYKEVSDNSCTREYTITVKVDVLFIGDMIAGQVANMYKSGLAKDREIIIDSLAEEQ